jgi:hypothetical protein
MYEKLFELAAYYRVRAARFRVDAQRSHEPRARATRAQLAQDWEDLADHSEREAAALQASMSNRASNQ